MTKRKPLLPNESNVYVYPQDLVDKWKMEVILEKHKKGKKILLGTSHTEELSKGDENGN